MVLKRHRCIHSFQPKIPCLRQHKQAVTLHLDDRALGFPFLLEPSERGSCRKHHLLERKRDREGDRRRRDKALGRVRHRRAAPGLGTHPSPPPRLPHPQPWDGSSPASAPSDAAVHPKTSNPQCQQEEDRGPPAASPPPWPGTSTAARPLFPHPHVPTSPCCSWHNGTAPSCPSGQR